MRNHNLTVPCAVAYLHNLGILLVRGNYFYTKRGNGGTAAPHSCQIANY